MSIILKRKFTPGDGWQYVGEEEAGGGGGGSLPDWWTVDSTPGSESVEFNGRVRIEGVTPDGALVVADDDVNGYGLYVSTDGISPRVAAYGASDASDLFQGQNQGGTVFSVGPTGAVTISPSDASVDDLAITKIPATYVDDSDYGHIWRAAFDPSDPAEFVYAFNLDKMWFRNAPGEGVAHFSVTSSDTGGSCKFGSDSILFTPPGGVSITAGSDGSIGLLRLPTSDPGSPGFLWNDAGTLKVSL